MLKIKFVVGDKTELAKTVINNIYSLAQDFSDQFASVKINKGEGCWIFEVSYMFINRDAKEMNLVFGNDRELKLISKLLGYKTCICEKATTRFSSHRVTPEYELDFYIPEELDKLLVSISLEFDVTENTFPYLRQFQLEALKPWQTWKDLILSLSKETQSRIFMTALTNISAYDCEKFSELETDEERFVYLREEMISHDLKEFVHHMLDHEELDKEALFSHFHNRAKQIKSLNSILKTEKDQ